MAEAGTDRRSSGNVLQDCLTTGLLMVDGEGKIIALTPPAERLLGLTGAQKQTRSLQTLPLPMQSLVREVQASGQTVTDREVLLHAKSVNAAALSVTAMPVRSGPAAAGVVLLFRDISSADRLQQEMGRLGHLANIGTLSASMAHEIKNALVPIKTFVELLLEKNPDAELAGTVRREMGRINTIVSRMLKSAAPAKPTFSPVRLHEILDHSLRLIQHRVESEWIYFNREYNAPSDLFSGDDHQLEQAFVNLLLNAVESMGVKGTLTVGTEAGAGDARAPARARESASGYLRVKITDTGAGIPPEQMGIIFEPFFTTKPSGTGLGLAVTRRVIEEHGGTIAVESQPGKGTTFTVVLPYSRISR